MFIYKVIICSFNLVVGTRTEQRPLKVEGKSTEIFNELLFWIRLSLNIINRVMILWMKFPNVIHHCTC